jgi:hypothetical protein
MANDISNRQNDEQSLRLLAAQRRLYSWAKIALAVQVVLVVIVPAALLIVEYFVGTFKVWAAFAGLTISILDVMLLDPVKAAMQRKAAGAQELFDCYVLDLEWPSLKGKRPDPEDLHGASRGYKADGLRDWYPTGIGQLPLYVGRVVCQRSNCSWDSKLRRFYRVGVICLSAIMAIGIVVVALWRNLTFSDVVLSLMAPILPIILWGVREARQQTEAFTRVDQLKSFGDNLWEQVVQGKITAAEATVQSRMYQDEIYERRQTSPMIFDWFYAVFKDRFEEQMTKTAEDMIKEARERGL